MTEPIDLVPGLRGRLPYVSLGEFPTPVERLDPLASSLGVDIWVKNDGMASSIYGGNKVRKLELVLGQGAQRGAKRLITFGGVGSHHAIACSAHGRRVGLASEVVLIDQPLTQAVRRDLLLSHHFSAGLHFAGGYAGVARKLPGLYWRFYRQDGAAPLIVPPGASSKLGAVGYALAALELKQQIDEGALPKPAALFLAVGSCGSIAGLLAGQAACGLDVPIVGVRVVDRLWVNRWHIGRLARGALRIIKQHTGEALVGGIPVLAAYELLDEYFGPGYGAPTKAGEEALAIAREEAGLRLEPTYTAKAFAALLDWARRKENRGRSVLFWNTHNAVDCSGIVSKIDWHELPGPLWKYFDGSLPLAEAA